MQKVLILGSGLVSRPMVSWLAEEGFEVLLANRTLAKAEQVASSVATAAAGRVRCFALSLSNDDTSGLSALVSSESPSAIVSLLPYVLHVAAAEVALAFRVHFFTTSYISAGMQALESRFVEAGVVSVNEFGVDPGLDHASAQQVIDAAHARGEKVLEFTSICGGLPAPEAAGNPLGYKLSWSPRGVLLASRNAARQLVRGEVVEVPPGHIFDAEHVFDDEVAGLELEWYYNRDALPYREIYGIPEAQTCVRATYRLRGRWAPLLRTLLALGLVDEAPLPPSASTYRALLASVAGADVAAVEETLTANFGSAVVAQMRWLGLLDGSAALPRGCASPLDAVCARFEALLRYAPGERDMIVMQHHFELLGASPAERRAEACRLVVFGDAVDSAMARTVSLPCAVAIALVVRGDVSLPPGLYRANEARLYPPVLERLEAMETMETPEGKDAETEGKDASTSASTAIRFEHAALPPLLLLRAETKRGERRTPLTPSAVSALIARGFRVWVERSDTRCFPDSLYAEAGARLVAAGAWRTAPLSAVVVGLKELPAADHAPLRHRHLYFAHCYKGQDGAAELLARFEAGGGVLWDLEFLEQTECAARAAAFGAEAGQVGAALALLAHAARLPAAGLLGGGWGSVETMVEEARQALAGSPAPPRCLVLGAKGRCGRGAVGVLRDAGVPDENLLQWDLEETRRGGPFPELVDDCDVLINCVYVPVSAERASPFITPEMLQSPKRSLRVLADVSCDYTSPANPLPLYDRATTLEKPTLTVAPGVDVIAIDHLPTLLPTVASENFSSALLPYVMALKEKPLQHPSWKKLTDLFLKKMSEQKKK